jgi:dihydrodiol dehydrogenase / D-xylose 1-dehydrogenase (NADP)
MNTKGRYMKEIRWGIIGAGRISTKFATALTGMDNTKLVAIASRNKNNAIEFANKFGIEKSYGSYEELVRDPDIDVIYIGTPNTEHKKNAELCIMNKKAVLCEKPFAINESESQYLVDLAKKNQVFLMEAMWTKFLPATKKVKEWIDLGRIGNVLKLDINFGFQSDFDASSRLYNLDLAGGALLDVGIYPIAYSIYLMNQLPIEVKSSAIIGRSGVDEQNAIIFNFENKAIATLSSAISAEVGQDATIIGDKGRIIVPTFWRADQAFLYNTDGNLIETFSEETRINGYEHEAFEVNSCLVSGKLESEVIPLNDTLNIVKIMDSLRHEWGVKYKQEIDS